MPLEFFGLVWFLLAIVLDCGQRAAEARGDSGESSSARFGFYLFCVSVVGLGGVLWSLDQLSYNVLLVALEYRIAIGCAVVLFVVAATRHHATLGVALRGLPRDGRLVLGRAPVWFAATLIAGVAVLQPRAVGTADSVPTGRDFLNWFASQPRAKISLDAGAADVLIVKFNDYQCPPCRAADVAYRETIDRVTRELKEKVRYLTLDYPLDTECNPSVSVTIHPAACAAAVSVRLARRQGRGREMEEWLWGHQASLSREETFRAAKEIGYVGDMQARYAEAVREMQADIELARGLRVDRTPTYFVNGVRLPFIGTAELESAIRFELRQVRRLKLP